MIEGKNKLPAVIKTTKNKKESTLNFESFSK